MINGISSAPIPSRLLYAGAIQVGCQKANFPPCVAYAIAFRESIAGQLNGSWPSAALVVSGDGGHGLFQLTSSYPSDWNNVDSNIAYALEHFLVPSMEFFASRGVSGDGLVRCIAAGFNSGTETAWENHLAGDVDRGTTNGYAADVFENYHRLSSGESPTE